ncbi:hypothetical protein BO71DRAFT_291001, partial [Aspergillus ellipticus CBS 707.79]
VYIFRQSRRRQSWYLIRWPQEDESLAVRLAYLHNANGFDVSIPFLKNHNLRGLHANPREFPI